MSAEPALKTRIRFVREFAPLPASASSERNPSGRARKHNAVVFGLTAEGFPTFFDLCILCLVLFIVILLFLRGLGLRNVLKPLSRQGKNLVRRLEGRELLSAANNQETR